MRRFASRLLRMDLNRHRDRFHNALLKKQVRNTDFTIIANNCWGSRIYQELGIAYNTPFVGLFFAAPCYLKMLANLDDYLFADLKFTNRSKYPTFKDISGYPIGLLGNEIEIHFRHYKSEEEAREKWFRRARRMNMDNLFVAFSDRDIFSEELLKEFDALPYKRKVCFTAKPYRNSPSAVYLPEYAGRKFIGDIYNEHFVYKRYFDIADWLNGGSGRIQKRTLISCLYSVWPPHPKIDMHEIASAT
jgi:uncharacterized protein (DUF1919 family)